MATLELLGNDNTGKEVLRRPAVIEARAVHSVSLPNAIIAPVVEPMTATKLVKLEADINAQHLSNVSEYIKTNYGEANNKPLLTELKAQQTIFESVLKPEFTLENTTKEPTVAVKEVAEKAVATVFAKENPVQAQVKAAAAVAPNSGATALIKKIAENAPAKTAFSVAKEAIKAKSIPTAEAVKIKAVEPVDAVQVKEALEATAKVAPALVYAFLKPEGLPEKVVAKREAQLKAIADISEKTGLTQSSVVKHIENSIFQQYGTDPLNLIKTELGAQLGVLPWLAIGGLAASIVVPLVGNLINKKDAPEPNDFPPNYTVPNPPYAPNPNQNSPNKSNNSKDVLKYVGLGLAGVTMVGGTVYMVVTRN